MATQVRRLKPGTRFRVLEREYELLLVNDCRAFVRDTTPKVEEFVARAKDGSEKLVTVRRYGRTSIAPTTEIDEEVN